MGVVISGGPSYRGSRFTGRIFISGGLCYKTAFFISFYQVGYIGRFADYISGEVRSLLTYSRNALHRNLSDSFLETFETGVNFAYFSLLFLHQFLHDLNQRKAA